MSTTYIAANNCLERGYFLGDVLESTGELARAQEQFSRVAQTDYNYKDVRNRVEALRKKLEADGQNPEE